MSNAPVPLNDNLLRAIGKGKSLMEVVDSGSFSRGHVDPTKLVEDGDVQLVNKPQSDNLNPQRKKEIEEEYNRNADAIKKETVASRLANSKLPKAIKESLAKKPPITTTRPSVSNNIGQDEADRMRSLMGMSPENINESSRASAPKSEVQQPNNILSEITNYGIKAIINESITNAVNQIKEEIKQAERETYEEIVGGDKLGIRIGDQVYICEIIKVKDVKK